MNLYYQITVNGIDYTPKLIDSDAKITWNKATSGLIYRSTLGGTFILNRSTDESCYDAIMAMDLCDISYIRLYDSGAVLVVESVFKLDDCEINEDKCQISISPRLYDKYNCLLKMGDKEYNALSNNLQKKTVNVVYTPAYEYHTCTQQIDITYAIGSIPKVGCTPDIPQSIYLAKCDGISLAGTGTYYETTNGWTFYESIYELVAGDTYNVTTTYIREVKKIIREGNIQTETPTTTGLPWVYQGMMNIGTSLVDTFARPAEMSFVSYNNATQTYSATIDTTLYPVKPPNTRGRLLNDLISMLIEACPNITGWESQFFKDNTNPISGEDLSNLVYIQKSDFIGTTSNPAMRGLISFNKLMSHLNAMFQVYWYIDDNNKLVIEHKDYFTNNLSYTVNNTVGIDLNIVYPFALNGSNAYSYNAKAPVREQFKFMEAWTLDFTGMDIDYSDCVIDGSTENYSAELFTTDIDYDYFDDNASKDGFVLLHCDEEDGEYNVISSIGALTNLQYPNVHLGWANLHDSYWVYDRPLPTGNMNGVDTTFLTHKKIKQQVDLSFPFCPQNFDPNKLIKTRFGDGTVENAEYSMKLGNIKVTLVYD